MTTYNVPRRCPYCGGEGNRIKDHWSQAQCTSCGSLYETWVEDCPTCCKKDWVDLAKVEVTGQKKIKTFSCSACGSAFTTSLTIYSGTSYQSTPSQVGKCPSCNQRVSLFSKKGAWCSTCQIYVYPEIDDLTEFCVEGEL